MKIEKQDAFISELLCEQELAALIDRTGCGLELIQFSVSENLDHFDQTLRQVRDCLARLGNPSVTIHGPFLDLNPMSYDSLVQKAALYRFEQAYSAAQALDAKRLVFHSGMIPSVYFLDGWADRMVQFWHSFLRDKSGVIVCMENVLDREYLPFRDVVQKLGHPDFGICLDLGHAHCYSPYSILKWAEALGPYIRHVHLHDNDGSRDQHKALGEGSVPWRQALSLLQEYSSSLTYTIECAVKEDVWKSWTQL